ncbi:hypothetical protein HDU81_003447 [Chytriomyces hyalinus]|nr:hypothetical protein HDU81_003447 [Chytriomyces hyalinus]
MIIEEISKAASERVFLETTVVQLCKKVSQMEEIMSTIVSLVLSPDMDDEPPSMDVDYGYESASNLDPMDEEMPPQDDCRHENKESRRRQQHSTSPPKPLQVERNSRESSESSGITKAQPEHLSEQETLPDEVYTSDKLLQFSTPMVTDIPPKSGIPSSKPFSALSPLKHFLKLRAQHFLEVNVPLCDAFQNSECYSDEDQCKGLHHCVYCVYTSVAVHGFAQCPRKTDALKEFQFYV